MTEAEIIGAAMAGGVVAGSMLLGLIKYVSHRKDKILDAHDLVIHDHGNRISILEHTVINEERLRREIEKVNDSIKANSQEVKGVETRIIKRYDAHHQQTQKMVDDHAKDTQTRSSQMLDIMNSQDKTMQDILKSLNKLYGPDPQRDG